MEVNLEQMAATSDQPYTKLAGDELRRLDQIWSDLKDLKRSVQRIEDTQIAIHHDVKQLGTRMGNLESSVDSIKQHLGIP